MNNTPKKLIIIVGAAVIAAALCLAMVLQRVHNKTGTQSAATIATLKPGASVNEVTDLPAQATFFAYLQSAMTQQQVSLDKRQTFTYGQSTTTDTSYTRTHFDYQTKRFTYAQDTLYGSSRSKIRCTNDGQSYKNFTSTTWTDSSTLDPRGYCMPQLLQVGIGDGFTPGGLTKAQSKTFIAYLQNIDGLLNVSVKPIDHQGKTYLSYRVQLHSVPYTDPRDGQKYYDGGGYLATAFDGTGLDAANHMYAHAGTSHNGMNLTYIVDPATMLPAYSKLQPTAGFENDGTPSPIKTQYTYESTYHFGQPAFDLEATKATDLSFSW